tara:strand:+ start:235 stop:1062 length:828 start_codon:yes stop_codon:yes gene_type:complete
MSKLVLYRAWIQNKKVVHRNYWAGSDDDETKKVLAEIAKKFPNETWPHDPNVWGVKMGANKYSLHGCSCEPDYKDSGKIQNSILLKHDFIKYFYDLDTTTKTMEIVYKEGAAMPVVTVPSNLTVRYITDMCNANFEIQATQAIYVSGTNDNVWAWAESLKSDVVMPISKNKKLAHDDDMYKFQFNNAKELTEVTLLAHLERYMVYGEGTNLYEEYTADYADELTNLADTEIVVPKLDNHGNRIAQTQSKENIKEYVKVPKSDGSGGYDTVLLKDL